jgi:hypothetical protein
MSRWFLVHLLALPLVLSGCNIIGYGMYAAQGEPTRPAEFVAEPRPTLVIVENVQSPGSDIIREDQLAGYIRNELEAAELFPVVRRADLSTAAMIDPIAAARRDPSERGREAGAEQVVLVDFKGMGVGSMGGADVFIGQAAAEVSVFDVATGEKLYPTSLADGRPVSAKTEAISEFADRPDAVAVEVLRQLARNAVDLFRESAIAE